MLVYEIDRKTIREYKGNIDAIIRNGEYCERDDDFVKNAFNNGRGTMKHFKEYRENNKIFCKWYDAETGKFI